MKLTAIILGVFCAATADLAAAAPAEWLASCYRCPAPEVTAKTGIGTANAVAEARMTPAAMRTSCTESEPNDIAGCVKRLTAESGKKIFRATADCTAGRITTIDDQQYTLAGIWDNSDIGGGRTKWRAADGQVVGRDNASGGLGISQQWELLCPGPVSAALIRRATTTTAATTRPAAQAPQVAAPRVCSGKRYCEESPTFAAVIRDFRPSRMPDGTRIVSATVQFLNKSNRPLILGYVPTSAVAIDERGNRYGLPSAASVRGIGEIGGREFDPKFTLAPGTIADTRFEFVWRPNGRAIIGEQAWDIELAIREANLVGPGQYRFGAEHALQFRGVPPAGAPAPAVSQTAPPAPEATTAAAQPTQPAAPEPPRPDACAGKRACFDAGNFVAQLQNATLTREGTYQDRVARLNVQIRNTGTQPLSLAYLAKSSVLTDNLGNRFFWGNAGTYDMSATGIGKVEANKADPQFTLAPGETRTATFTLRRRAARTDADAATYNWNVTLTQLEALNTQQIRTGREFAVSFTDFGINGTTSATAAAPAAAGTPANQTQKSIRDLSNAIRGLGGKKR